MTAEAPLSQLAASDLPAVAHLAARAAVFAEDAAAYRRLRDKATDPLLADRWDVLRRVADQTAGILAAEARALAAVQR